MNAKTLIIASLVLSSTALARRGDRGDTPTTPTAPARPETINCALYLGTDPAPQAAGQALVENSSALIKGSANGVDYIFSVRGKTAVAKLSSPATKQVVTAQGAIEMLRNGGRGGGNDDGQDGKPEKEAGFELSIASETGSVKLKCLSTNEVKK